MPDATPSPQQPSMRQALQHYRIKWAALMDEAHTAEDVQQITEACDAEFEAAILALLTTAKLEKLENTKDESNSDWFYGYGYNQGIDAQYAAILRRVRGEDI